MVHAHVRDGEGQHVLDAALYRQLQARLGQPDCDILLQVTTEAAGRYAPQEQMALVRALKPAAVSIALRELMPADAGKKALAEVACFFAWLRQEEIWPQFILYEPEEVQRFLRLQTGGDIPFPRPFLLFVLGRYGEAEGACPEALTPFLKALGNAPAEWMMCAFGPQEHACAQAAIATGGHVRVGFENNLHRPDGSLADSTAELVALAAAAAKRSGRGVMNAAELARLRHRTL